MIFPEGDLHLDGTLPFKRAVFEIAARLGLPVVPVARFRHQRLLGHAEPIKTQ